MGDVKFLLWSKTTVEELKAFLGFSILMGVNSFWKRDPHYHYAPVADKITRDRFLEISRYFHFVDNNLLEPRGSEGYDRLGKVRPLITSLTSSVIFTSHIRR